MRRHLAKLIGVPAALSSFLLAGATHAQVNTSTIITAVAAGVDDGTNVVGDFISGNISGILLLGGIVIGIFLVWRLFKRVAR